MSNELAAPRALTPPERAKLRARLKVQLHVASDDDADDAEDLLDYVFDMVEGGKTAGHIAEELLFMEMPVCGEAEAKQVGEALARFFASLENGDGGEDDAARRALQERLAGLRKKKSDRLAVVQKSERVASVHALVAGLEKGKAKKGGGVAGVPKAKKGEQSPVAGLKKEKTAKADRSVAGLEKGKDDEERVLVGEMEKVENEDPPSPSSMTVAELKEELRARNNSGYVPNGRLALEAALGAARKKDGADEAPQATAKKEKEDLPLPSSMSVAELKEELRARNETGYVPHGRLALEAALGAARKKDGADEAPQETAKESGGGQEEEEGDIEEAVPTAVRIAQPSTPFEEGNKKAGVEKSRLDTRGPSTDPLEIKYEIRGGDEITNRVCDRLEAQLSPLKMRCLGQVLTITVDRCTEGDRYERMCCAELGMGWVHLDVKWELMDENGTVLASGASNLSDSGNIGCSDLGDSNYGENALLEKLTPKLAMKIISSVDRGTTIAASGPSMRRDIEEGTPTGVPAISPTVHPNMRHHYRAASEAQGGSRVHRTAGSGAHDNDGKGLGVATLVLLLISFVLNFIPSSITPYISGICNIAALIMVSSITCKCCGAAGIELEPNAQRFISAALLSLSIMFLVNMIGVYMLMANDMVVTSGIVTLSVIILVLNVVAMIFVALFVWGRNCGDGSRGERPSSGPVRSATFDGGRAPRDSGVRDEDPVWGQSSPGPARAAIFDAVRGGESGASGNNPTRGRDCRSFMRSKRRAIVLLGIALAVVVGVTVGVTVSLGSSDGESITTASGFAVDGYPNCYARQHFSGTVGDGVCHLDYNTEECGYDGGDCRKFNELKVRYPRCGVQGNTGIPQWGDGICNALHRPYATEACGWDAGDCVVEGYPNCVAEYLRINFPNLSLYDNPSFDPSRVGNGECEEKYDLEACGFDGGDCEVPGYVTYANRGCDKGKELGWFIFTLQQCVAACDEKPTCISFSFNWASGCKLSTSCVYDLSTEHNNWNLFLKASNNSGTPPPALPAPVGSPTTPPEAPIEVPPGYIGHPNRSCAERNELGSFEDKHSVSDCAAACDAQPACISFEYRDSGSIQYCLLSTSCAFDLSTEHNLWNMYVKEPGALPTVATATATEASIASDPSAGYEYMGEGMCRDGAGNGYSKFYSRAISSLAACMSFCDRFRPAGNAFRGIHWRLADYIWRLGPLCYCNFDADADIAQIVSVYASEVDESDVDIDTSWPGKGEFSSLSSNGGDHCYKKIPRTPAPSSGVTISGLVYYDINQSSSQESDELGVPDITVQIRSCANERMGSTQTNTGGEFTYSLDAPGCYYARLDVTSLAFSPEADVDPLTGMTEHVTLADGEARFFYIGIISAPTASPSASGWPSISPSASPTLSPPCGVTLTYPANALLTARS